MREIKRINARSQRLYFPCYGSYKPSSLHEGYHCDTPVGNLSAINQYVQTLHTIWTHRVLLVCIPHWRKRIIQYLHSAHTRTCITVGTKTPLVLRVRNNPFFTWCKAVKSPDNSKYIKLLFLQCERVVVYWTIMKLPLQNVTLNKTTYM